MADFDPMQSVTQYRVWLFSELCSSQKVALYIRVSQFVKKLTKHFAQEICHYVGYNNALSKFSEISLVVYYSEIESEIYKGNSE